MSQSSQRLSISSGLEMFYISSSSRLHTGLETQNFINGYD